jgi:hypothetical protein
MRNIANSNMQAEALSLIRRFVLAQADRSVEELTKYTDSFLHSLPAHILELSCAEVQEKYLEHREPRKKQ